MDEVSQVLNDQSSIEEKSYVWLWISLAVLIIVVIGIGYYIIATREVPTIDYQPQDMLPNLSKEANTTSNTSFIPVAPATEPQD